MGPVHRHLRGRPGGARVSGGADSKPTQAPMEVAELLAQNKVVIKTQTLQAVLGGPGPPETAARRSWVAVPASRCGRQRRRTRARTTMPAPPSVHLPGNTDLPASGRWIVYWLPQRTGAALEAWVEPSGGEATAHSVRQLYRPPSVTGTGGRTAVGPVLYVLVFGPLVTSVRPATVPLAGFPTEAGASRPTTG